MGLVISTTVQDGNRAWEITANSWPEMKRKMEIAYFDSLNADASGLASQVNYQLEWEKMQAEFSAEAKAPALEKSRPELETIFLDGHLWTWDRSIPYHPHDSIELTDTGRWQGGFFFKKIMDTQQAFYVGSRPDQPEDVAKAGVKFDGGKTDFSLVPWDVVYDVADLFTIGGRKYAARNWEKGFAWSRSFNALQRHLYKWWELGEEIDPENGIHHLTAVVWNAMVLRRFTAQHKEFDDRTTVVKVRPFSWGGEDGA